MLIGSLVFLLEYDNSVFQLRFIKTLLYCLALIVLFSGKLISQPTVLHLTEKKGLTMGYVTTVFQDSRGFIWMGSFFGLNRYDGHEIRVYRPDHLNPWALHANKIDHILEDPQGLLWLCTENGIAIMDTYSERIVHLEKVNQIAVHNTRKALLDKKGKVWLYQENQGRIHLLGIQTGTDIRLQIRQGKIPKKFQLDTIAFPGSFGITLNAFIQTSDSTAVAINTKGKCMAVNLTGKTAEAKELAQVSKLISPDIGIIEDPLQASGAIFFSGHDFNNGIKAEQMHQFLRLPDNRFIVSRFYDQKIFILDDLAQMAKFSMPDILSSLPVFHQLPFPSTFSRLIDRNANLWIGTTGNGIFRISTKTNGFVQLAHQKSIYNLVQLPDRSMWAGFLSPQSVIDLQDRSVREAPWEKLLNPDDHVNAALCTQDQRHLYLFVFKKASNLIQGYQFDPVSKKLAEIPIQLYPFPTPNAALEDSRGDIWVSGHAGQLFRFNPRTNKTDSWDLAKEYPAEIRQGLLTSGMIEATNGQIWIANNYGLVKIEQPDRMSPKFTAYHNYREGKKTFANNGIFALHQDREDPDMIWIGTLGNGLAKFHIPSAKVSYLPQDDQLNQPIVLGIQPDGKHRIWLSTNQGITCFDTRQNHFIGYDLQEELQTNNFNATSSGVTSDGKILFGSADGLFVLNPSLLLKETSNSLPKKIELVKIQINNAQLNELLSSGKATFSNEGQLRLKLKHYENNIQVQFAAPFAQNASSLYFRYKVLGLANRWINIGKQNNFTLTGLPPGKYSLFIRSATPENQQLTPLKANMEIRVLPPFYASKLAWLLYLSALILIIAWIITSNRKRLSEKYQAEIDRQEMQRLQSLDTFKNKFFAYIAHEIKTPLSIILGIGEKLQQENKDPEQNQYLETIQYEGNNMLGLVDEIMDITRIQDGSIRIYYRHGDIVAFLKNVLASYQPLADFRDIQLRFQSNHESIFANFDDQRIRHIINNLINNALQNTPDKGTVTLSVQSPSTGLLQISVTDTGRGIAASELPFIFEKYYQGSSSAKTEHNFGLGLSYVKDLVMLMNGQVFAESTLGKGSIFTIDLPLKSLENETVPPLKEAIVNKKSLAEVKNTIPALSNQNLPLLLIVEDNPMIVSVLKLPLAPYFRLMVAKDGREGLDSALAEIPDLILTDVVMPVMDGLEMTRQLKSNPLTAHIPVVVLSAKNEIADRIAGQECGADAYIGKPYHAEELLLTLRNLQTLQSKWKAYYAKHPIGVQSISVNSSREDGLSESAISASDTFMQSLYQVFQNHYHIESFDVQQLCRLLHISKAQLYRKLSAISDQGPMEMLRDYRLDKALEFLQNDPDLNTSEVAFKVGFKERTYFSTQFKKKFGIAPSMVRAARR